MLKKNIMDYDTVSLDEEKNALRIINQTKLPNEVEILTLTSKEEIRHAIYTLQVRGAPAIGVAAAIGIYVTANAFTADTFSEFYSQFKEVKKYLAESRPTAINLFWALDRMENVLIANKSGTVPEIKMLLRKEAMNIKDGDIRVCKAIGENGLHLIQDGDSILTYCNAGQLAAVRYGTALAPLHIGREKGYHFKAYVPETRPLLQGARLSALELVSNGIDTTIICDSMVSKVMQNGWIQAVFVGCDRVAANGDVCNKIGTSGVAVLARHYNIPFYVCAPASTIDLSMKRGKDIRIEEREPYEISELWYKERMSPDGAKLYNPAFDITPHELITAVVNEYGIVREPYGKEFEKILEKPSYVKITGRDYF